MAQPNSSLIPTERGLPVSIFRVAILSLSCVANFTAIHAFLERKTNIFD